MWWKMSSPSYQEGARGGVKNLGNSPYPLLEREGLYERQDCPPVGGLKITKKV